LPVLPKITSQLVHPLILHSNKIACRTLSKAKQLIGDVKNATPASVDVSSQKELDDSVSKHDLIISLIPYTFHIDVIKSAIKYKRNVVTTSYVSDAMKALEPEYLQSLRN
jgi:saccharopine dehydrogenase-like NADP-dependent oxidoreductase